MRESSRGCRLSERRQGAKSRGPKCVDSYVALRDQNDMTPGGGRGWALFPKKGRRVVVSSRTQWVPRALRQTGRARKHGV